MKTRFALATVLLVLISVVAFAQLKPEQTLNRRAISDVRFSPDGERVAFTVSEPVKGSIRSRHIWTLQVNSRAVQQFTSSAKSEFAPRWSPDGQQLAFLSDREDTTQIYLISLAGGEALKLTSGKNAVRSFEWSPDGKQIAFLAPEAKTDAEDKKEKDKDDARVVDRDDKHARLWLIDIEKKSVRQLTSGHWQVDEAKWTPTGDRLIVSATDHPEVDQNTNRIFSIAASDGGMQPIAAPRGPFGDLSVSPDGQAVAYLGARVEGPAPHDLYLQLLAGGPARNLTGTNIDRPIANFLWTADGPILALLAMTIGGLLAFGPIGLFLGPITMALLLTLWRDWTRPETTAA